MGSRAVARFGKANGAGAVGSEEESTMAGETVLEGGPGTEGTVASPFKFKFGDKEFSSEQELTDHLSALSQEVTTLKAAPPTIVERIVEKPAATATPDPNRVRRIAEMDNEELMALSLSDPRGFAARIQSEVRSDLTQEYNSVEQGKQNMIAFWDNLWKDHPELKAFESTVKTVFEGNRATLGPMKLDDARKKLGELAVSTITSINKDAFKRGKIPSDPKTQLEGGGNTAASGGRTPVTQTQTDTKPRSITAMIQERAKARRNPQHATA